VSEQSEGSGVHQTSAHPLYLELHETAEFVELRKKFRGFVIPATIAFMSWYLLYVVMSNWAHDFMSIKLVGNINVALVFGLLQFVSTFSIAVIYSRFASRRLDPLAGNLRERYYDEVPR
jgi:uncharacterized membrane protein (DUF485 family)